MRKSTNTSRKPQEPDRLLNHFRSLAKKIEFLGRRALILLLPKVKEIMESESKDVMDIERTLDALISIGNYQPAVGVFKKLCRYYSRINREDAARYQQYFDEMWD